MKVLFSASCSIGIAAVQQHAGIAVDVGDPALGGGGGAEARIVGEDAEILVQVAMSSAAGPMVPLRTGSCALLPPARSLSSKVLPLFSVISAAAFGVARCVVRH